MDKKTIQSFRTKIKKASTSFSVMGDMILHLQIDAMTASERTMLQEGLKASRAPLNYGYLDQKVQADKDLMALEMVGV